MTAQSTFIYIDCYTRLSVSFFSGPTDSKTLLGKEFLVDLGDCWPGSLVAAVNLSVTLFRLNQCLA